MELARLLAEHGDLTTWGISKGWRIARGSGRERAQPLRSGRESAQPLRFLVHEAMSSVTDFD